MSDKICLTLEQALRRLNPHLILESSEFKQEEKHRVRTWLGLLSWNYLRRDSSFKSDIYNGGRVHIDIAPPKDSRIAFYTILQEPAVNEFSKKYR